MRKNKYFYFAKMYKASSYTLLKCIVFLVVWTCCWGKKSPKSQFYVDFGLVGEVFLLWQAAKAERRC